MRILALDPGGTTGMAVYRNGSIHISEMDVESVWYRLAMTTGALAAVLVETYRPFKTSNVQPALVNGAARLLAIQHGALFHEYAPGQCKTLCSNDTLRALGWWDAALPHAADAARLIVCYALLHCPGESAPQQALVDKVRAAKRGERAA